MQTFSREEVSKHNKINDCWIIIYDEIYNITDFMKKDHTGGFIPLSVAGLDATNLFITSHPSYVKTMLNSKSDFYNKYHVGTLIAKSREIKNDDLYFKLKNEVEKYMEKNKLKARDISLFDYEICFFILITLITYKRMLFSVKYSLLYSILHGISFTFMITRTIHDCNHGALTKKKKWKRYLFTFINEILTTNQFWQEKHNLHHMYTNDINKDPDKKQLWRLSKEQPIKKYNIIQYIYTFLLYPLLLIKFYFPRFYFYKTDPEPIHGLYRFIAKILTFIYIYLPIKYSKFIYWIYSMLLGGFYLAVVFTVNHDLYYLSDEYINNNTFLEQQLSTTTDYNPGSKLTNFITHGLNHQVIHHLFPSINYHNYPRLTKDVLIPFCKKYNLKYHGENDTFLQLVKMHIISIYKWRK